MRNSSAYKCIIAVGANHTPILIRSELRDMLDILGSMDNLLDNECHAQDLSPGLYECRIVITAWQDQTPDSCDYNMDVEIKDAISIHSCFIEPLPEETEESLTSVEENKYKLGDVFIVNYKVKIDHFSIYKWCQGDNTITQFENQDQEDYTIVFNDTVRFPVSIVEKYLIKK